MKIEDVETTQWETSDDQTGRRGLRKEIRELSGIVAGGFSVIDKRVAWRREISRLRFAALEMTGGERSDGQTLDLRKVVFYTRQKHGYGIRASQYCGPLRIRRQR